MVGALKPPLYCHSRAETLLQPANFESKATMKLSRAIPQATGAIAAVICALLSACAIQSGPRDSRYSVDERQTSSIDQPSGIVFGKICHAQGITVARKDSSDKILHIGGQGGAFALKLPEGSYELVKAGGQVMRDERYVFEVIPGKTIYVGTLITQFFLAGSPDFCTTEDRRTVAVKSYVLDASFRTLASSPPAQIWLASDVVMAKKAVLTRYPNLDLSGAIIHLMH
jgi:hypothetical protein